MRVLGETAVKLAERIFLQGALAHSGKIKKHSELHFVWTIFYMKIYIV